MPKPLNKKPAELIQGKNVKVMKLADRRLRLYYNTKEEKI